MAAPGKQQRLAYIDWMRGLACLLMFQTHCYDSWLGGAAREGSFIKWSQLGGTLPAPLFLFLAGVSFALVTDRMRSKGISANEIALTTIRRGAEIYALGLLFRVQEFVLGQPWAPWTDLLRVDILNTIGLSMMMMGIVSRLTKTRAASAIVAALVALAIALATPPLWTTWRILWLPWYLESYINGVHTYNKPQPWLFPIFPWTAFAFAGLALGFLLFSDWAKENLAKLTALVGLAGVGLFYFSAWLDARPAPILCRVRLLAHEPQLLPGAGWNSHDDCFPGLRVVPLGSRAMGLQSADPDRANFVARLLGAHRICLRAVFDSTEARRNHSDGDVWLGDYFYRDGSAFDCAHAIQRAWR